MFNLEGILRVEDLQCFDLEAKGRNHLHIKYLLFWYLREISGAVLYNMIVCVFHLLAIFRVNHFIILFKQACVTNKTIELQIFCKDNTALRVPLKIF